MDLEKALQRYLRLHKAANHSQKTVEWHYNVIHPYLLFLQGKGYSTDIDDLDPDTVREWLDDQRERACR